jgi:hypothetical protein
MASINVPQESPSLALSSRDPYSTSAKLRFQIIFARKCPFDSQRLRARREITWGGRRSSKASRFQGADLARIRAVGSAVGGLRVWQRRAAFSEGILWTVGNGYSHCRLDEPTIAAQVMDSLGEENRTRNCPSGRRICSTKYTTRWPTAPCVAYCGQRFLSTNRRPEALRNEGNRRTPLLQFKNTPIRAPKSAFPKAHLLRGLFFLRARGSGVESPEGIAVEGST